MLLLSKPFSNTLFVQAMHMAAASNHRLQRLRQENARLQDKISQIRLVSRAKCCLVEHEHLTEPRPTAALKSWPWTPAATAPRSRRKSLILMRMWVYNIGLGKRILNLI